MSILAGEPRLAGFPLTFPLYISILTPSDHVLYVWRGGVVVRASDLPPRGLRFESRPLCFTQQLRASCSQTMCLCSPSSINWYRPLAGTVTVGLASHWPCVTDSVVYPPTGSMAWEREMSTLPKLHWEYYGIFTFTRSSDRRDGGEGRGVEGKYISWG